MPKHKIMHKYHLPIKGYDIVAAINRRAAATGSFAYAMRSANASYNGHNLTLTWNEYNGYYIDRSFFGERVVIVRSSDFATALAAAKAFYAKEGLGASVRVEVKDADLALAQADPDLIAGEEIARDQAWWTWKHDEVSDAMRNNTTHHLIAAKDADDYCRLCREQRVPTKAIAA